MDFSCKNSSIIPLRYPPAAVQKYISALSMMKINKILCISFFLAIAAHSQQMRVAVISTVDDVDSLQYTDLNFLTGKLREIAGKVLPKDRYGIMTQESIVDRMGSQERAEKECREASCLADLGRKISAAYIAQGHIGRFGGMLTLKVELYNSKSGNLVGTFNEISKDLFTLATIVDNKAPDLFREIMKENKAVSSSSQPSIVGGTNASSQFRPSVVSDISDGMLTDSRDGKKYKVVKIGNQTWMAENLNYDASGSKCYKNKPANCTKYGRLYNWATARAACPSGWYLPSNGEYEVLDKVVGEEKVAGRKLKAKSGWNKQLFIISGNGTDDYGFSALPGGYGSSDGSFFDVGDSGYWWSATESSANIAYYRYMSYINVNVYRGSGNKSYLYSVRCAQN